jgi:hypothetical protein
MKLKDVNKSIERRHFIARSFAASAAFCMGCSHFLSSANAQNAEIIELKQNKTSGNSGMTYEQVFNFAYRNFLIPQLVAVSKQIGREKFIEILKKATDEVYSRTEIIKRFYDSLPKEFMNNVLDLEVIESSTNQRIFKITKCLWAKTFREAEAGDIGYALLCYGDYASARSENEKLERETTLMEGCDYCLLKWTKL